MLMRRLANGYNTAALEVLVDVIEPLKIYERNEGDTMYNMFSPYTKIADVATPDQKVAREFRKTVAAYCVSKDKNQQTQIMEKLNLWKKNDEAFIQLIKQSPVLQEAAILSTNLERIATIGIQALHYIATKASPPSTWKAKSLSVTKKALQQGGRCELQVVTAINQLIDTAAKKSREIDNSSQRKKGNSLIPFEY